MVKLWKGGLGGGSIGDVATAASHQLFRLLFLFYWTGVVEDLICGVHGLEDSLVGRATALYYDMITAYWPFVPHPELFIWISHFSLVLLDLGSRSGAALLFNLSSFPLFGVSVEKGASQFRRNEN